MGIETITTSAEALAYINSHLNITTAELQQLASQMRADVPNALSVLLYSGNLQTIPGADALPSFEIAEFIGSSSPANAKVGTIGQTEAGKLLSDAAFEDALTKAVTKDLGAGAPSANITAQLNNILYGPTAPDGTRTTPGLWDTASERFIDANVKPGIAVNTLTPTAEDSRIFTQTEIKKLLNGPAISVDGIPRQMLQAVYDQARAAECGRK